MTLSIKELGNRFWRGETSGQSSRTKIIDRGDHTYLIDYDWAVLGKRNKNTGKVSFFSGWYGYSQSTNRHIRKSRLEDSCLVFPERMQVKDIPEDEYYGLSPVVKQFRMTYEDIYLDPRTNKWKLKRR